MSALVDVGYSRYRQAIQPRRSGRADSRRTDEDYNGFDNVKEEVAVLCAVLSSMDVADTAKVSVSHRESGV